MNIAIVGAQGTGKSALARALHNVDRPDGMPDGFNATEAHALQQAVSHDLRFQDPSHYPQSLEHHRNYGLTLVMGLDLPFASPPALSVEDLPPARFDARLRQVLNGHGVQFTVVYGRGQDRTDCALQAITHHTRRTQSRPPRTPHAGHTVWQWNCETCSDAACEHLMFSALLKKPSVRT